MLQRKAQKEFLTHFLDYGKLCQVFFAIHILPTYLICKQKKGEHNKIVSGATKNKLSPEDVQNILAEVKAGTPQIAVARKYGVDHTTVFYYLKRKQKTETKFWPEIKEIEIKPKEEKPKEKKKKREKFIKKIGSSYKELLALENEKRKKQGLYLFKNPTAGFYK